MATLFVVVLAACSGGHDDDESLTTTSSTRPPRTSLTTTTTSTTEADDCTTLLQNGCEAEVVRNLQRLRQRKIDRAVAVDGKFGPQTEGALRAFERNCDICVEDGQIRVGGDEWNELDGLEDLPTTTAEGSPGGRGQ